MLLFPKFTATLYLVSYSVFGFQVKVDEPIDISRDAMDLDTDNREFLKDSIKSVSNEMSHLNPRLRYQTTSEGYSSVYSNDDDVFDSWSVVWYVASFGGLIAFFLVVSCSEWCCRKHIRDNQAQRSPVPPSAAATVICESPPPAYDLFAPPSYDSLSSSPNNEKTEYDIYVVPVHAISSLVDSESNSRQENPPSYSSINVTSETNTGSASST